MKRSKTSIRIFTLMLVFVLAFSVMNIAFASDVGIPTEEEWYAMVAATVNKADITPRSSVFIAYLGSVKIPVGNVSAGKGVVLGISSNSANSLLEVCVYDSNNTLIGNKSYIYSGSQAWYMDSSYSGCYVYIINRGDSATTLECTAYIM